MKRINFLFAIFAILTACIFCSINLISASFNVQSNSVNFSTDYSPGSIIRGKFNISIDNEEFNSYLTAFDSNITLKNFLDSNGLSVGRGYACTSSGCGMVYSVAAEAVSKSFSLGAGGSRLIGIKIIGDEFDYISSFRLNVSSSVNSPSCSAPVSVYIGKNTEAIWTTSEASEEFCTLQNNGYGYYDSSKKQTDTFSIIEGIEYCSKINLKAFPKLRVGANLVGSGTATFVISVIGEEDGYGECEFTANNAGERGCIIELINTVAQDFDVCITAKTAEDNNKYSLNYDKDNPQGSSGNNRYDFSIFARTAKYAPLGTDSIVISSSEIDTLIEEYISDNYDNDCSGNEGCVIPLKIVSGADGNAITLSNSNFCAVWDDGSTCTDKLYDSAETPSKISMQPTSLDFSKAGFKIPRIYGAQTLSVKLGGQTLFEEEITVLKIPVLDFVYPQKVPVGLDVLFKIFSFGDNVTDYTWDFGDNTSVQKTSANTIVHRYSSIGGGIYTLTIKASNKMGNASKSFDINVVQADEYAGLILNESRTSIAKVKTQVTKLDAWVKDTLLGILGLDNLEAEIGKLDSKYQSSGGSATITTEILNSLDMLNVPSSLETGTVKPSKFIANPELIDLTALTAAGAGAVQGEAEQYRGASFVWSVQNLNVMVDEQKYSSLINSEEKVIATRFKLKISPKSDSLGTVYFVIGENIDNIVFKHGDLAQASAAGNSATGIVFSDLSGGKELEFIIKGDVDTIDLPAYFSPAFADFSLGIVVDVCNNNGICDNGETTDNCRADCAPVGWIIFWLFILFLTAFIAYLVLQQWYKYRYEGHLFKNKDDLFNLINFIDNAEKQGLRKEEIFRKLKEKKWASEQIDYAWKKYKGERTGMWEIPIFALVEKARTMSKIKIMREHGFSGKVAPIPISEPLAKQN